MCFNNPDNSLLQSDKTKGVEYTDHEIQEIINNYLSYRRQYVGLIIGHENFIYFNSFPAEIIQRNIDNEPQSSWIEMEDGGSGYWQILVGIDRNKCSCLSINGEA